MILTLDFTEDDFMDTTFYFAGFVDGKLRGCQREFEKKRIHFGGDSVEDCISNASDYAEQLSDVAKCKLLLELKNIRSFHERTKKNK